MSVVLRELVSEDSAWLDGWLPTVTKAVACEIDTASALITSLRGERRLRARIIERDGPAGLVLYKINAPKRGSACFELVAIPGAHARRGAGMIAAALIEDEMRAAGVRIAYAPAAAVHGISLYFWIRLGYAPLMRTAWPCDREGVVWLRRSLGPG